MAHAPPAAGQAGATAAVKATAAALCPEGKDEEPGRSSTSPWRIHSVGGLRRPASGLPALAASCATAIAASPATAAERPRRPPSPAMTVAAPQHNLVHSAVSSTADSACPTV